jgi:hypothetical protein
VSKPQPSGKAQSKNHPDILERTLDSERTKSGMATSGSCDCFGLPTKRPERSSNVPSFGCEHSRQNLFHIIRN